MKRWGWHFFRLFLAGVFIWAGVAKAIDPTAFVKDVASLQLVPNVLQWPLALYLPMLELVCGIALLLNLHTRGAAAILTALMTIFLAVILVSWLRGLDISCGCFGGSSAESSYTYLIVRNIALLGVALMVFRFSSIRGTPTKKQSDGPLGR